MRNYCDALGLDLAAINKKCQSYIKKTWGTAEHNKAARYEFIRLPDSVRECPLPKKWRFKCPGMI